MNDIDLADNSYIIINPRDYHIKYRNKLGLSWAKLSHSWGLDVDWLE